MLADRPLPMLRAQTTGVDLKKQCVIGSSNASLVTHFSLFLSALSHHHRQPPSHLLTHGKKVDRWHIVAPRHLLRATNRETHKKDETPLLLCPVGTVRLVGDGLYDHEG